MPTKRKRKDRPLRPSAPRITPRAIALFREMQTIECECAPRAWHGEYWRHRRCAGCERSRELHEQLIDELGVRPTKPWEDLQITPPDVTCPYPEFHVLAREWRPDRRGQRLYRLLQRAAA
jgi:hypothetical protein